MAKKSESKEIVLITPSQLVGPGSAFEKQRNLYKQEVAPILAASKELKVISVETAEKATEFGRLLVTARKEREPWYKNIKSMIDGLKKPILEAEKSDIGELEAEGQRLGSELTAWNNKQRALREEEERKSRELAEQAMREELLLRACELEAAGDKEAAEAVLEEPVMAPVVIQSVAPPKVQGQVAKYTYSMEVTDLMTLVKAVAEGRVLLSAIEANESFLNSKARNDKEGYSVPGTKLVRKESTFFRS